MTRHYPLDKHKSRVSPGRDLRNDMQEAVSGSDDAPFEGGTVVGPATAWHVLEYHPEEDRTYYLGPTDNNTPRKGQAFLTYEELLEWLDSDTVFCERLEK